MSHQYSTALAELVGEAGHAEPGSVSQSLAANRPALAVAHGIEGGTRDDDARWIADDVDWSWPAAPAIGLADLT